VPTIAYLAHPVGTGPDRAKNRENVNGWFLALFHASDRISINVPWKIYVDNLDESHLARAMRDDLAVLGTCSMIILTGGRISPGMKTELLTAKLEGLRVLDLTDLGYNPPRIDDAQAIKALAERIAIALH
jgi:hypothetical protein